ncbi:MAG: energy transducer TonB [Gammaproteobacteria bacterium]
MITPAHPAAASRDRFVTTFFLAALFHGIVIMGVSFSNALPPPAAAQAFEVLLVRGPAREKRADEADYLAQFAQDGAGNTQETVNATSAPHEPTPFVQQGATDGNALENALPGRESAAADLVVSRSSNQPAVANLPDPTDRPAEQAAVARELRLSDAALATAADPEDVTRIRGESSRELVIAGRTKQSNLAPYLVRWKNKVEQIGTLNFPDRARRERLSGSPTLEVVIRADGTLDAIVVRRSSGEKLLDQAALRILRLAAPFEPFPEDIRRDYDLLRFVYEWQFIGGEVRDSAVRISEDGN